MRSFVFAVLLAGACAHSSTGPNDPVNVAAVRNEIKAEIKTENDGRTIQSMGRTRHDSAVVYTTTASGERLEETWAKVDGRWKLQTKTALK
jgi:hypothetical protein